MATNDLYYKHHGDVMDMTKLKRNERLIMSYLRKYNKTFC